MLRILSLPLVVILALLLIGPLGFRSAGAEPAPAPSPPAASSASGSAPAADSAALPSDKSAPPLCAPPTLEVLTAGTKKVDGLWPVYHKDQQLLVDLPSSHLDKNFIVLTSIARGVSNGVVIGGMSWGFGDSIIWSFRKVGDKVHVLRRNVRFRATPGTPEADAVKLAYSDSVLYSLPILTNTPSGHLVDMTPIFMSDDLQIGRFIGMGFRFASDRSTLAKVKSFPKNVEIQVAAVYAGAQAIETVSDPRGVQVYVHYSISMLPENGYHARRADDRVGYFVTAVKDFSDQKDDQNFVRYINRWDLKKKDPNAKLSPPEHPIVFYIEKTVPVHLRPYVQEGVEEWNKAFEKLGFSKAIVVLQQGDEEDWDPEDIRYNTFRWITAESGFAMGPARVNPMTGQILDADIIFDASFLEYWKQDCEMFTSEDVTALMGGIQGPAIPTASEQQGHPAGAECMLPRSMQQQMGFAAAALTATGVAQKSLPDAFIHEALKSAVMHEVGHTLGLRHNFKGSAWRSLEEIQKIACDELSPTVATVMDYCPANIAPEGTKQAHYFTPTIGPYDLWIIEYGYKPIAGGDEDAELGRIAARAVQEGLEFATDEDARMSSSDPFTNPFDLGDDPIAYARRQMATASKLIPKVTGRLVEKGEGYQRARQAFGMLLAEYWRAAYFVSRLPGGVHVHRDHKGDPHARPPFEVVEAMKQREAMQLLARTAFASPQYDPELLNHLAATRWTHWGLRETSRLDYPIHDVVSKMQGGLLGQLLSPTLLSRLHDNELKVPASEDLYTLAEHLRTTIAGVFTELEQPGEGICEERKPFISSFRRTLQTAALKLLSNIVTSGSTYPEDARTLSRLYLAELNQKIDGVLSAEGLKLDDYSRAHLVDSRAKIHRVLEAQLQMSSIN